MKKILPLIFTALLLFSCIEDDISTSIQKPEKSQELTSSDFVKGSEDIPLVSDLELIENENVGFDSESGSFVVVDYKSPIDLERIQNFYLKTLPQMGWKLVKNDQDHSQFAREGEKLAIEFIDNSTNNEQNVVHFSLSSAVQK